VTEPHVKLRALAYLVEHRRQRRQAPYSVDSTVTASRLGRILGVPLHDLVHTLWDLQKLDAIRFRERKYARAGVGRGDLDHFQVTARGMALLAELRTEAPDAETPPVVVGIPVELPAFMENVTGHPVALEGTQGERANGEDHALPPLPPELVGLYALQDARAALQAAAETLEANGMEDLAISVIDRMPALTPAEGAILAYLEHVKGVQHVPSMSHTVSHTRRDTQSHPEHKRDATSSRP